VSKLKQGIKKGLKSLGMLESALELRDSLDPRRRAAQRERRAYRHIGRWQGRVGEHELSFGTEDAYSNAWFYPRYAGGALHEPAVTALLLDALREASCLVDVGTNLGWYTCVAAKHLPEGRVYGFEMDELNLQLARRNLELNRCRNAELFHRAVSDSEGELSYERDRRRPSAVYRLSTDSDESSGSERVTVRSIRLDDFFDHDRGLPRVLKIDVEGAEMRVLRGMQRLIERARPTLFLELHPPALPLFGNSVREILGFLGERGYSVHELEDLRGMGSERKLHELDRDSVLEQNTMLYCVPQPEEA
jgi:FkbM family methyltransferase